ncbi:hypothetical protein [Rhodococcus globerulus]|uniref:hypothetical protein n=1 Tax=Rhodococcus globerulus TaxID=33008 RepID=UPI001C588FBF|nr:hypothetical protein [Rhodococcus globerulus]QXW04033.1 hypothetical protein KYT97_08440 [Rhodococcus globerulus]
MSWRIATPEELAASEAAQALQPKRRAPQMQCVCGRFVNRSTYWRRGLNINGMSSFGWLCSHCGDVVENS